MALMLPLLHPSHNSGVQRKGLRPSQVFLMPSAHGWCAAPPACFEHRVPGFDRVVPQHPPPGLGYRWPRRNPVVSAHRNPLGMNGGCVWLELHHLLLLWTHQPAISPWLFRWFVGGAVTGQCDGATATVDSSAKHLLLERCLDATMATSHPGLWTDSSKKLFSFMVWRALPTPTGTTWMDG